MDKEEAGQASDVAHPWTNVLCVFCLCSLCHVLLSVVVVVVIVPGGGVPQVPREEQSSGACLCFVSRESRAG